MAPAPAVKSLRYARFELVWALIANCEGGR